MICENDLWKPSLRTTNAENHLIDFFLKFWKLWWLVKPAPKTETENCLKKSEHRPTLVETIAQHLSNPCNMGFLYLNTVRKEIAQFPLQT
jgi:hypothetical protein